MILLDLSPTSYYYDEKNSEEPIYLQNVEVPMTVPLTSVCTVSTYHLQEKVPSQKIITN